MALFGVHGLVRPKVLDTADIVRDAIFRQLEILSDIRPLLEYRCYQITISFRGFCDALLVSLSRESFGTISLPVAQQ